MCRFCRSNPEPCDPLGDAKHHLPGNGWRAVSGVGITDFHDPDQVQIYEGKGW